MAMKKLAMLLFLLMLLILFLSWNNIGKIDKNTTQKDTLRVKEIFEILKKDFDEQFKSLDSVFLSDFLKNNSFKMYDFYTKNYFQNHLDLHQKRIEKMIKEMDS